MISKYKDNVPVEIVFQSVDKLPAGFTCPAERTKPWGTTQAVLMGAESTPTTTMVPNHSSNVSVEVLDTPSRWFGVTYSQDRPDVVAKFAELHNAGVYPTPLFG